MRPKTVVSLLSLERRGKKPLIQSRPPSSSGLGRRPFTAVTRVQIPLGVLVDYIYKA